MPHAPGVFDLAWRGCEDATEFPLLAQAGSDGSLYVHRSLCSGPQSCCERAIFGDSHPSRLDCRLASTLETVASAEVSPAALCTKVSPPPSQPHDPWHDPPRAPRTVLRAGWGLRRSRMGSLAFAPATDLKPRAGIVGPEGRHADSHEQFERHCLGRAAYRGCNGGRVYVASS